MANKKELEEKIDKLYKSLKTTKNQVDRLLIENQINNLRKTVMDIENDNDESVVIKQEIAQPEPHIEVAKEPVNIITNEEIINDENSDKEEEDSRGKVTFTDNSTNKQNYNKHNRKNK